MLFLFTILAVFSALVLFAVFAKRRKSEFLEENPRKNIAAENLRPLFAPDADEMREYEREEHSRLQAKKTAKERLIRDEKIESVRAFRENWRISPDKRNTIELLRVAAESQNAKLFSETAENVIKVWREKKLENLTAEDLAELLDSHFRTLPQQERTSGAAFWLKQEIKKLRSQSEENR